MPPQQIHPTSQGLGSDLARFRALCTTATVKMRHSVDVVELADDLVLWDVECSTVEVDVFASAEISHQAGTHFDQRRYLAFNGNTAVGGF